MKPLADGEVLELAGLEVTVDHAPGHTRGSVAFRLPYDDADVPEVMLSGDLLFAGSIGRTDLPGGDHATMLRSLAAKVLPLRDEVVVLPGHGPQTTIGRERATNPFLQDLPDRDHRRPGGCSAVAAHRALVAASPSGCPAQRIVEQHVLDTLREVFELHGFASIETRVGRAAGADAAQGRDRQGGLRPAPAAGWRRRPTPTAPSSSACTST